MWQLMGERPRETIVVEIDRECTLFVAIRGPYNMDICTMREDHECVGLDHEDCPLRYADMLIKVRRDA